ncbi:MAG: DUF1080 domain-containing protein [Verrucomicrobiota bacterium]|nr:DUF1080 domain-containing protein [Verrucomicrobiota bacterium]
MKPRVLILAMLVSTLFAAEPEIATPEPGWKALFNGKDLSNWDKFLATPGSSTPLVPNVDPKGVFSITNENGENLIHVSGEIYGAITTHEVFTNFHFRVQFKWGMKRWPARGNVGRDSGILYCAIGAPNPGTGWMTSVENNIMEKGVGQWWSVNGARIDCEGEWITAENELYIPYKKEGAGEKNIVWKKGAPRITATGANGITPPFDVEEVFGNWNTVEVVFWGGNCIHILNGHVNLVAFNPRYQEGGVWKALTHGKIQLQSEAAELFYRKAEVRPLFSIPAELLDYVVSPVGSEEGFKPLLEGDALKEWKQSGPGKFKVSNGVASGEGGMGLWWYSGKQFTNFVIRGEFLQEQEIADSGVFLRFPDPGNDPWVAVKKGHEMEIGDSKAEKPEWKTGAIYPFRAPSKMTVKPTGEWNSYEIVCKGHDYSVRINDVVVNTWTDVSGRSASGYIGLQNYNDDKIVRHRNLRIKELP